MTFTSPLKTLPADKVAHFFSGGFLFALCAPFGVLTSILICAVIAYLKELLHDKLASQGQYDVWDFLATTAGGLFVAAWLHFVVPLIQRGLQ